MLRRLPVALSFAEDLRHGRPKAMMIETTSDIETSPTLGCAGVDLTSRTKVYEVYGVSLYFLVSTLFNQPQPSSTVINHHHQFLIIFASIIHHEITAKQPASTRHQPSTHQPSTHEADINTVDFSVPGGSASKRSRWMVQSRLELQQLGVHWEAGSP